jgi:hypothetical protein
MSNRDSGKIFHRIEEIGSVCPLFGKTKKIGKKYPCISKRYGSCRFLFIKNRILFCYACKLNGKVIKNIYLEGYSNAKEFIEDYRKLVIKVRGNQCERCGVTNQRLDLHHKDKNRENTTSENVLLLCKKCHNEVHSTEYTHRP